MDRREALKKLAVGGALAAGGSIVLSSNNVAFAQSTSGPPSPDLVSITTPTTGKRGAGIIKLSAPNAPDGASDGTTYEWQIRGCSVPNGRTLVIINSANGQIIARGQQNGCSPFTVTSGPLSNAPSVDVRTVAGGSSTPKELSPGDSVNLRLIVKWNVNGAVVEGLYAIGEVYPSISAS